MEKFKFLISIIVVIIAVVFITNSTKLLKKPTDIFVVEKGSISYEETTTGYVIRNEYLLQGENYKNGMVQIKYENEKVYKGFSTEEAELVETLMDRIRKNLE